MSRTPCRRSTARRRSRPRPPERRPFGAERTRERAPQDPRKRASPAVAPGAPSMARPEAAGARPPRPRRTCTRSPRGVAVTSGSSRPGRQRRCSLKKRGPSANRATGRSQSAVTPGSLASTEARRSSGPGRTAATRRTSATSSVISHGRISEVRRVEGSRACVRNRGHRGIARVSGRPYLVAHGWHTRGSGRNAVPGGAVI
jgi:hypothetical protein